MSHLNLVQLVADVEQGHHLLLAHPRRQHWLHDDSLQQALPYCWGSGCGDQRSDGLVQRRLELLQAQHCCVTGVQINFCVWPALG